jgi:crotonobetainyl-CoA:carnitine CoA-transferase CaiB-like acyl-CoA transferase
MAPIGESLLGYAMNNREPIRDGNRDPYMAPYGVFRCLDDTDKMPGRSIDMWVAISVADDAEFARLTGAIGQPELASDPRFSTPQLRKLNEDALEAIVTRWTAARPAASVEIILQRAGVAASICATNKDLNDNEHLAQRGYYVAPDHPEIGMRKHPGIPWKMSLTQCAVRSSAPLFGQHTEEILTGLLGYTRAEVRHLHEIGALDPAAGSADLK